MEKIKNIEFLRFIFALIIVYFHFGGSIFKPFVNQIPFYNTGLENCLNAYMPVWFFFIISGFFLFLKIDKTQDYIDFAKKKLIRFMPIILFTLLLCFIASLFTPYTFLKYENIFTLLNLQCCGLTFRHGNLGVSWFISVLFWTISFYFYLYKCVDKKLFNLIVACIVFFCYAMIIHHKGMSAYKNIYYVLNYGMLIGFANVGLGYFISNIYKENIEKIKNKTFNICQTLFCTAIEIYTFIFLFYYMCMHKLNYNNSTLLFIIIFSILLWMFLIKKGYLSRLLNNDLSVFLGQFSFSIFIMHAFIIDIWKICIYNNYPQWVIQHPVANIIILSTIIIFSGVLAYYLVEKPATKYLKKIL